MDQDTEETANKAYNNGITLCADTGDNRTPELLRSILVDEEKHLDWLEAQLTPVGQIGGKNYLVEQIG